MNSRVGRADLASLFELSGHVRMNQSDLHRRVHRHVLDQLAAGQLMGYGEDIVVPVLEIKTIGHCQSL